MRKLFLILLILIGFFSEAQVLQFNNTYGWEFRRFYANTLMGLPKDTFLVPATLQDIPFIANKAGTLYTWDITTHVWGALSAGSGASGIDDVLAIGQSLTANRTINLNGNELRIEQGGNGFLTLDAGGISSLRATDGTANTNVELHGEVGSNVSFELKADDNTNQVTILGDAIAKSLDLTADSIRFIHNNITSDTSSNYVQTIDKSTGTIGKAFWPSGGVFSPNQTSIANTSHAGGGFDFHLLNSRLFLSSPNNNSFDFEDAATGDMTLGANAGYLILSSADSIKALSPFLANDLYVDAGHRLRLGVLASDLSSPVNGDLFYNTGTNKFRAYENGAWVNMIAAGTVSNVATGLGLSGGPITTTGTILVDTASASILSRQRAAATYQPLGVGITTLNTLTDVTQTFAVGTTGTDFNIASAAGVHTFHIPDAAAAARGLVNTGSQTFAGSKTLTGFTNLTGGHASSTVAGNSNLYVTGGTVANRTTVAAFLPESAAGLGGKVFINGSTAYTMTASDAFSALTVASNLVTEAGSGTHPLISALVLNAPVVTNGAGATANMATFYINAAPSGVTPTGATYAQWIKAGGLRLGGDIIVDKTITAAGTTGNQTINKLAGTVNIAAAGTTVTVTNSFCATTSIVFAVIRTNDSTAVLKNVVPGAGSFVINLTAAANAEVSIGFLVTN